MMRSVSLVERVELEFSGNHFSQALALGDLDGDNLNELVVGGVDGVLAVFRGSHPSKPWRDCSNLGTITSVAIGDLFNNGQNVLVCVSAEGLCYIFDLHNNTGLLKGESISPPGWSRGGSSMRPAHTQQLGLNIKSLLVSSIDPEGCSDLFVGYTDRAVGAFRWCSERAALVAVTRRLELEAQIGSMSVTMATEGEFPQLLVAQAGGTYIPLVYCSRDNLEERGPSLQLVYQKGTKGGRVGVTQRRNPTVCTELVAGIFSTQMERRKDRGKDRNLVATCTLDGSIKLLRGETKQWELQADHSFFSLHKLDITGSGSDEIVACAWDGMTYIVDLKRNVVKYSVGENVAAFCAGYYGMAGHNTTCLVYTTFTGRLLLYHTISLPSIPSTNLLLAIQPEELPEELSSKWKSLTDEQRKELIHNTLYGTCTHTAETA